MLKMILNDFIHNKTSILFSIVILTTVVLPVTYSRYIYQEQGMTVARLAKWEVDLIANDDEELELVLQNNVTQINYLFKVTSTSDVACDYSIILNNIPTGITLQVDNDQVYIPVDGKILIENLGSFEINSLDDVHEHTLTFIANSELGVTTGTELDLQVDIKQRVQSSEVND